MEIKNKQKKSSCRIFQPRRFFFRETSASTQVQVNFLMLRRWNEKWKSKNGWEKKARDRKCEIINGKEKKKKKRTVQVLKKQKIFLSCTQLFFLLLYIFLFIRRYIFLTASIKKSIRIKKNSYLPHESTMRIFSFKLNEKKIK